MNGSWRRFWARPAVLRRCGILGMNRRNASYILPHNPRALYQRVDDKLLTKQICQQHGIPVPHTYAIIERQGDVRRFAELIGAHEQFVIKPTCGSEGRGILVMKRRRDDGWITAANQQLTSADVRYHLAAVLAGLYSLSGRPDRALVEQRISRHPAFAHVSSGGTPDIRVVVYRRVPAMAMLRLPTRASRGRANLHQGAAAAGIDLIRGITVGGICRSRVIRLHPDTQAPVAGIAVPYWRTLLEAAVRLADRLEMGYLGIDFVLDEHRGPFVLEANARPGLTIQLANRVGLLDRLRAIDAQLDPLDGRTSAETCPLEGLELLDRIAHNQSLA